MKSNAEIRKEARGVVRSKWFWRIFSVGGLLYLLLIVVAGTIDGSFRDMNIQTWTDFFQTKAEAFRSGLDYAVPSVRVAWQMTGASVFQQFMACVFGSILMFGLAGLMLKAVRNDEKGWFGESFGGFKRPLELTWLMVLMNLKIFLWGLLFVIPGLVAVYRYRQAWYLKSEHPDWSAGKCLAESGALMKGKKGQAFFLDLSFLGWLIVSGAVLAVSNVGMARGVSGSVLLGLLGSLGSIVGFYFFVFVLVYLSVARAVFYRELFAAPVDAFPADCV